LLKHPIPPPQKKVGCISASITSASTFSWIESGRQTELIMSDNPRTQEMFFLVSTFFIAAALLFEIGSFVYILRHPPNNPVLLGESSVGTTTARALGLPR
jgi:hypothetical protein